MSVAEPWRRWWASQLLLLLLTPSKRRRGCRMKWMGIPIHPTQPPSGRWVRHHEETASHSRSHGHPHQERS